MNDPLWYPSEQRIATANLTAFMAGIRKRWGAPVEDFGSLHTFSCEYMEQFWRTVWSECGVVGDGPGNVGIDRPEAMPGARFFPEAKINFAENLLRRRGSEDALVFWGEDRVRRRLSRDELATQVISLAAALRARGVEPGDHVVGYLPNIPESIVAMLAAACIGAIWSSCSPDFGARSVLDRFGQTSPVVLVCADGYLYKGTEYDSLARVAEFIPRLPRLRHVLVAGYLSDAPDLEGLRLALGSTSAGERSSAPEVEALKDLTCSRLEVDPNFRRFPFNQPLYVLYSSGTTGIPKCIVHGAGGTLIKHLAEHQLCCDVKPRDRMFFFTTCGWMMWNWLVSGLASGATLMLYDGHPFYPCPEALFDYARDERITLFGISARYVETQRKAGVDVHHSHKLPELRSIISTGSPLMPEGYNWVYERVKADVCLSSISGGTDLIGCLVGGNPIGPVWRGEIQAPSLGMAVDVFDEAGCAVRGQKGELVCTRPFPSMPLAFWNDEDHSRYRAAYFEHYPGIWRHGDFAEITERGGVIIYGRSDTTLNPGGVRIGTAEIYRVIEGLDEVLEALVIGQSWKGDVRIVLFLVLRPGAHFDATFRSLVRAEICRACSHRHVPARIIQVDDIPRTKSGKITELAVRDIVHGLEVENRGALENPEALDLYINLEGLSR